MTWRFGRLKPFAFHSPDITILKHVKGYGTIKNYLFSSFICARFEVRLPNVKYKKLKNNNFDDLTGTPQFYEFLLDLFKN